MKTRKIGNLEVSNVGMGCMGFSHGYGQIPEREYSIEAIRKAYAFGCTFFDTAEGYGNVLYYAGHNEEILGEAVEVFRDHVILATKFHLGDEKYNSVDELYDIIVAHFNQSCKNLRTDYIDLYYLHRINENIPVEDIAAVMKRMIEEGKIKGWGMSQATIDYIKRAQAVCPLTAIQNLYNMLERDCEAEILPYLMENNIGLVPFSPIASGFLSGKVTSKTEFGVDDVRKFVPQLAKENIDRNQPILDLLEVYATKKNATKAQISIAWMLHKYPNIVPIPGSKNQERILENLGGGNIELTDEEFKQLDDTLNQCTVYGHRGHNESEQNSFGKNWQKAINKQG